MAPLAPGSPFHRNTYGDHPVLEDEGPLLGIELIPCHGDIARLFDDPARLAPRGVAGVASLFGALQLLLNFLLLPGEFLRGLLHNDQEIGGEVWVGDSKGQSLFLRHDLAQFPGKSRDPTFGILFVAGVVNHPLP
jgi:hypothetical protein